MPSNDPRTVCVPFPQADGFWTHRIACMLDTAHRLVLRWSTYLDFDDVVRIDHASLFAWNAAYQHTFGLKSRVFGSAGLPIALVPYGLVFGSQRYASERAEALGSAFDPRAPVFDTVLGEAITRASLRNAVGRALTLDRLAQDFRGRRPRQPKISALAKHSAAGRPWITKILRFTVAAP